MEDQQHPHVYDRKPGEDPAAGVAVAHYSGFEDDAVRAYLRFYSGQHALDGALPRDED
jgi:hypothetical protein